MEDMSMKRYKKEERIDIDVAIGVAQLSKESLMQLNSFVKDYIFYCCGAERIAMFCDRKKKLSTEEFINFCRSKLKLDINSVSGVFEERSYYKSLLRNYKKLLSEIMGYSDEVLNKFFETIGTMNSSFYQLLEYLKNDFGNRDLNLSKLKKIKELGIRNFIFDKVANLDGIYTVVVLENREKSKDDKKVYGVRGYACDGVKEWDIQTDEDGYNFNSKGANYMISYVKGTAFHDDIDMIIRSLDFDMTSLPSREELWDITVLPDIDFDLISKKTRVVNLAYAHERSLKAASELLEHSEDLIFNLEYGGFNQKALEIKKQLIFLEAFIATAKDMSGTFVSEYVESGVIKTQELRSLVTKKRNRDLEKERYFNKKK